MPPSWRIVPFDPAKPEHQDGVVSLILNIQRGEFGFPITVADQPDLLDIPGFYLNGSLGPGCFLVAEDAAGNAEASHEGRVAGSIALKNIGPGADGVGQGALRKMFVRKDMRGKAPSGPSGARPGEQARASFDHGRAAESQPAVHQPVTRQPEASQGGCRAAAADPSGGTVAGSLLAQLEAWCAENGVGRLYLGTTERFLAAHRFYEKHGFARISKADLPASFPVMAVDSVFYAKTLP